jgi:hypothetical protein
MALLASGATAYPAPDSDGDGHNATDEAYLGTNPWFACGKKMTTGTGAIVSATWPLDLHVADGALPAFNEVNIQDVSSFISPIRRLDTSPPNPLFDARWDLNPGINAPFTNTINISDLTTLTAGQPGSPAYPPTYNGVRAFNGTGATSCLKQLAGDIRFYGKITTDSWWPDNDPDPGTMDANYEFIHHWQCGGATKCQRYPTAFNNGPAVTYVDFYLNSNGNLPYFESLTNTPGWILDNATGGDCLQSGFGDRYIGNFTDASFRAAIVGGMVNIVNSTATDGIYIDVAEPLLFDATSCTTYESGVNSDTFLAGWANLMAELRTALGANTPLVINTQPHRWDNIIAISATNAATFFSNADLVEIEHGWASVDSAGGGAGTGDWTWDDLTAKIVQMHEYGIGVFTQEYSDPELNQCTDMTLTMEKYSLAMQFLIQNGQDFYGTFSNDGRECGDTFASVYNTDLGTAVNSYYTWNGLQRRDFLGGTVLINNPGGGTVNNIDLTGYTSIWGEAMGVTSFPEKTGIIITPRIP